MSITPSRRERERVVAPNHRDISRRRFLALAGVSAFTLSSIGSYSTLAYFTDTDSKTNNLDIAQALDIEVVEPSWDPENGMKVVPTETIPKDPYVHNLSTDIPGYMYIEIRVPIVTASIFNEETQKKEDPAEIPLFSYTPNEGWTEINTFIDDTDADNKVQVTRYYWKDVIEPDGVTETIFDEVIVANLTSGEGVSGKHTIEVVGYGIQSEGFDDALSAWTAYKNQNGIKDGEGNTIAAVLIAGAEGNKLQFVQGTPKIGDMLDAGEVIEVVEDVEHLPAQEISPLVSEENRNSVLVVEDIVPTKPENTVNWFKDMESVTEIDISGLDTSGVTDKTGMFEGTSSLKSIKTGANTDIVDSVPKSFDANDEGYSSIWLDPTYLSLKCKCGYLDGEWILFSVTSNKISDLEARTGVYYMSIDDFTIEYVDGSKRTIAAPDHKFRNFWDRDIAVPFRPRDPLNAADLADNTRMPSNPNVVGYSTSLHFWDGTGTQHLHSCPIYIGNLRWSLLETMLNLRPSPSGLTFSVECLSELSFTLNDIYDAKGTITIKDGVCLSTLDNLMLELASSSGDRMTSWLYDSNATIATTELVGIGGDYQTSNSVVDAWPRFTGHVLEYFLPAVCLGSDWDKFGNLSSYELSSYRLSGNPVVEVPPFELQCYDEISRNWMG